MDRVKTSFSIKIWSTYPESKPTQSEFGKRYNLFEPERTETNIRLLGQSPETPQCFDAV